MAIIVGWILLSFVVAVLASNRGRTAFGWFFLSLLISPLIAGLLLLASKNLDAPGHAPSHAAALPSPETHVKCPDCAELVLREARVCKHCGCKLTPLPPEKPTYTIGPDIDYTLKVIVRVALFVAVAYAVTSGFK